MQRGTTTRRVSLEQVEPVIHVVLLAALGLAYRATFITQGFNATDEGWLQSVGRRITLGQVPYRDFDFVFPRMPVSIFKEAALQALFGDSYTLLFARWVFVGQATLGSVIAYLIIRRFVTDRLALLATVPTVFFSVLAYYYSNYTFDAEFLLLASMLFLTLARPARRWPAVVAGVLATLSGLSKPNYFAFVVLVPALAIVGRGLVSRDREVHPALVGLYRLWPLFLASAVATFGVVLGLLIAVGAGDALVHWPFAAAIQVSTPQPLGFAIWQDLPTVFSSRELKLFGLVFAALIVAAAPVWRAVRLLAVLAIPIGLTAYSLRYLHAADGFLTVAEGLLLVVNVEALALALVARSGRLRSSQHWSALRERLPAPELVLAAIALQYFAQFTTTGILYSYLGAFLSVPVALLVLKAVFPADSSAVEGWGGLSWASVGPALLGVWISAMSVVYVQNHVYFDAPRAQLTATFQGPKLAGIRSTPANVRRLDGIIDMVNRYSKPGDPILVAPDLSCVYFLTDRTNPTRQDWLGYFDPTPSEIDPVQDLRANPPKVVFLQSVSEFDWSRSRRPDYVIDYSNTPISAIYTWVLQNYQQVGTVDDIAVYVPKTAA